MQIRRRQAFRPRDEAGSAASYPGGSKRIKDDVAFVLFDAVFVLQSDDMNASPVERGTLMMTAPITEGGAVSNARSCNLGSTVANQFLAAWDSAWGKHDANALGELHTADATTVNRFGTLVIGRSETEKALAFLHSQEGPFGHSKFPSLELLHERQIAPTVIVVQAGWKNPVMFPSGKISETEWNDMIVTFVLVQEGQTWKVCEVDAHNVEKMDLPFSNAGQKS